MALPADVAAHLLAGGFFHVDAAFFHGLDEGRVDDAQVHRLRIMTVCADDGVLQLGKKLQQGNLCVIPALLLENVGQLGRLAGHAGAGRVLVYTLRIPDVLEGIHVPPVLRVIHTEGHPFEVDEDLGFLDGLLNLLAAAVTRGRCGHLLVPQVALVLQGVILPPNGGVVFPFGDRGDLHRRVGCAHKDLEHDDEEHHQRNPAERHPDFLIAVQR